MLRLLYAGGLYFSMGNDRYVKRKQYKVIIQKSRVVCNGLPENLRKNKELPASSETGSLAGSYISLLYLLR